MNGSGRPVTDSPAYKGDLFFIEVPCPTTGTPLIHKVSTNIIDHQKHIDSMVEAGNRNFGERRVRAGS